MVILDHGDYRAYNGETLAVEGIDEAFRTLFAARLLTGGHVLRPTLQHQLQSDKASSLLKAMFRKTR